MYFGLSWMVSVAPVRWKEVNPSITTEKFTTKSVTESNIPLTQ
jgi:hypothetical protein